MEIVNKAGFEYGAPTGINEYKAPPGVIAVFLQEILKLLKF